MKKCPFKDIIGRPGEGIHSIRFLGFSVVDTAVVVAFVWALAKHMKWEFWKVLVITLIIGEIVHWYFCVDSAVIKKIKELILNAPSTHCAQTEVA